MMLKFKKGDKVRYSSREKWGYGDELLEIHNKQGFLTISEAKKSRLRDENCYGFAEDTIYPDGANWLGVEERFRLIDGEFVGEWK